MNEVEDFFLGIADRPALPTHHASAGMVITPATEKATGRYCCKSPFALAIKNFPGFRRDFRVKMWGTSSPDDKLAGDLGNAIEGTRISGRRSDFFLQQENWRRAIWDFCNNIPQKADITKCRSGAGAAETRVLAGLHFPAPPFYETMGPFAGFFPSSVGSH
jgi:hypothetical protein